MIIKRIGLQKNNNYVKKMCRPHSSDKINFSNSVFRDLGLVESISNRKEVNKNSTNEQKRSENGYVHSACLTAVLNGPENLRDIMSAYRQIKNGFKQPRSLHSGYDNKTAQHPFSFFRGTILAPYLNPLSPECPNPRLASWLVQKDKTLWDTKFGEWVKRKLKISEYKIKTDIEDIDHISGCVAIVPARVPVTNNIFKDILARAMLRTPVLGLYASGITESVNIANNTLHGANFFEELKKSAVGCGVGVAASGVLGAIGAKHYGSTGSLAGIAFGTITGNLAKKLVPSNPSNLNN